ncbi:MULTISPECIES: FeoA family protein [Methanosarcina]|jgi:ferrous iron transport protein A|uniref:Ferrous iron transport protein A n=7 Tax=Methanosarcina mazei TaxID=2209 RepID=A0A0F8L1R7_METMZ|nr:MULTISPECIES: ferrous iron transport protein A [Methanosarcina]AAM32274.1 Ferrous iron transport protein A [Methanosarcina mazei Go1]AKB41253.1 Ferrous iron transport protein A [Methanosarcina mazei WWM610]AKB61994.1 Ferrous iron transport protein A [Methanosarcina mazei SarPi]AKB65324.1 Ferrous iron transport protein A [Methanosarcina mazei S-6]AKB69518.1 Ferrous iron transport protein A [Methanosarcina mazei LYC]
MTEIINKTLNMLETGQKARVIQVKGGGSSRKRLLDMGMVPGTVLSVSKKAPLGDPVDFKLKGYNLSLRKKEAEMIIVEQMEG